VAAAVDALLRGYPIPPEERYWDEDGKVHIQRAAPVAAPTATQSLKRRNGMEKTPFQRGLTSEKAQHAIYNEVQSIQAYEPVLSTHAEEIKIFTLLGWHATVYYK